LVIYLHIIYLLIYLFFLFTNIFTYPFFLSFFLSFYFFYLKFLRYDELIRLYDELKEHIGKEMLDLIQDVMRIKTTVHDNLLKLEQSATEALNEAQEK